jgi:hypothetical protein
MPPKKRTSSRTTPRIGPDAVDNRGGAEEGAAFPRLAHKATAAAAQATGRCTISIIPSSILLYGA